MIRRQLVARRLNTRTALLREKVSQPKLLLKIFAPIVLGFLIIPVLMYFGVNFAYSNRLVQKIEDIPAETKTSIIIFDQIDILERREEYQKVVRLNLDLFNLRKINEIKFYVINDISSEDVSSIVESDLSRLGDRLTINLEAQNQGDVCIHMTQDKFNKGIIFANTTYLIRVLYLCNSIGLYYTGFKLERSETIRDPRYIGLRDFLNDSINILLNKQIE